jgi:hypothetical protein
MLKMSIEAMKAIERGDKLELIVVMHFQTPETYTATDYLGAVGALTTGMSSDGIYEIANTTLTMLNKGYYFSRKLARELPNNKLTEIFVRIAGELVLLFRGVVAPNWTLTDMNLNLNINA